MRRCADEMVDGKWNKFRDDVTHDGRKIDWGKWAITGNDPVFGGTGNPDTGEGCWRTRCRTQRISLLSLAHLPLLVCWTRVVDACLLFIS